MRRLFLLQCLLTTFYCYADDTYIELGIGGISVPSQQQVSQNQISLTAETVDIALHYAFYEVSVEFLLSNPGNIVKYKVGFPVRSISGGSGKTADAFKATAIVGFNTSVDDEPVKFSYVTTSDTSKFSAWYVKDVAFKANSTTKIEIRYVSEYGSYGGGTALCDYYFGTGSFWKGSIEKFDVHIANLTNDEKIYRFSVTPSGIEKRKVSFLSDNSIAIGYANYKPNIDDRIEIYVSGFYGENFYDGKFDYPLDEGMLTYYTKKQLRIQRNAYFAKHGMIFASDEMKDIFEHRYLIQQGGWYKPSKKNVDQDLNELDKANISLIQKVERERSLGEPVAQTRVANTKYDQYVFEK